MIGLLPILPLLTYAVPAQWGTGEMVTSPRVAQVRLAETLAEAESIESITTHVLPHHRGRTITFVAVRDGEAIDVTAKTNRAGEIVALAIEPSAVDLPVELHALTWLGSELADCAAVTKLVVDDEGSVVIATDDGRRYMAIPGRGSGGANVAVESRWAAAWNTDDGS